MLEARYFKDYKHNYMILQCGQEAVARSYQYKILTSDKIRDILRCSVRHINGTTYYYYDISSRATLKNLYQSAKMSYDQVKDLLWQLRGICDRLAGFFMEESGLVLLPEHIYYDFSSQRYIGLYYPDYKVTGPEAYEPLMNFLLEHIDTEDRQLTENMYRICEMAGEAHFLIEDALQILEEKNEVHIAEQETVPDKQEILNVPDDYEMPPAAASEIGKVKTEQKTKQSGSIFYPVFAVLSALGIAGAAAVYNMYELVQEEEIALYGIMAVLGVCFLFGLWGSLREGGRKRKAQEETEETADLLFGESFAGFREERRENAPDKAAGGIKDGFSDRIYGGTPDAPRGEDPVSLGNVISKDMGFESGMQRMTSARADLPHAAASMRGQETDYYGNTIFYDESKMTEYKLYAVDRRNKQHIELKQFPCTIGKMAGCVDYVLADNSVSRIHARFDRQGDRVLMTDMNSTNGTYKNGLRMQPQETVEIEPGDEIRFGNLNYCYR